MRCPAGTSSRFGVEHAVPDGDGPDRQRGGRRLGAALGRPAEARPQREHEQQMGERGRHHQNPSLARKPATLTVSALWSPPGLRIHW
jgi:hypothetical protein